MHGPASREGDSAAPSSRAGPTLVRPTTGSQASVVARRGAMVCSRRPTRSEARAVGARCDGSGVGRGMRCVGVVWEWVAISVGAAAVGFKDASRAWGAPSVLHCATSGRLTRLANRVERLDTATVVRREIEDGSTASTAIPGCEPPGSTSAPPTRSASPTIDGGITPREIANTAPGCFSHVRQDAVAHRRSSMSHRPSRSGQAKRRTRLLRPRRTNSSRLAACRYTVACATPSRSATAANVTSRKPTVTTASPIVAALTGADAPRRDAPQAARATTAVRPMPIGSAQVHPHLLVHQASPMRRLPCGAAPREAHRYLWQPPRLHWLANPLTAMELSLPSQEPEGECVPGSGPK